MSIAFYRLIDLEHVHASLLLLFFLIRHRVSVRVGPAFLGVELARNVGGLRLATERVRLIVALEDAFLVGLSIGVAITHHECRVLISHPKAADIIYSGAHFAGNHLLFNVRSSLVDLGSLFLELPLDWFKVDAIVFGDGEDAVFCAHFLALKGKAILCNCKCLWNGCHVLTLFYMLSKDACRWRPWLWGWLWI